MKKTNSGNQNFRKRANMIASNINLLIARNRVTITNRFSNKQFYLWN
jgi:hypothetical protein